MFIILQHSGATFGSCLSHLQDCLPRHSKEMTETTVGWAICVMSGPCWAVNVSLPVALYTNVLTVTKCWLSTCRLNAQLQDVKLSSCPCSWSLWHHSGTCTMMPHASMHKHFSFLASGSCSTCHDCGGLPSSYQEFVLPTGADGKWHADPCVDYAWASCIVSSWGEVSVCTLYSDRWALEPHWCIL